MTIQSWIKLLVPIIGLIIAVVSASLTYFFAKKQQIASDERRLKEEFYLTYIKAISNFVVSNKAEGTRVQLADALNQLLLVGSAEVITHLMNFHDYANNTNPESFHIEKHDEYLTKLLKSMRKDLYKNKSVNIGYPCIHLTSTAPRE